LSPGNRSELFVATISKAHRTFQKALHMRMPIQINSFLNWLVAHEAAISILRTTIQTIMIFVRPTWCNFFWTRLGWNGVYPSSLVCDSLFADLLDKFINELLCADQSSLLQCFP
jgi:hypothetical protein